MKRNIDALTDGTFDLLILGGGITGAGVALDATLRGFRVALIDKADFASGTSSVSSKLVHGGIRYLEHAHFHLVYEALRERRLLLQNAPHLVHPLRFVIPFYRGARVRLWKWRAGLTLYDLLAGRDNIRRSRPVMVSHLTSDFPELRTEGLSGGAEYYDAQMDDARLCLAVIWTAAAQGAAVANYVEAIAFERVGDRIASVRAVDRVGGAQLRIRARQVLNATGPWVDAICRMAGDATGPNLRPTKGVHIVVADGGLTSALLLLHPADGRVFFVIPWMGKTLIGTTDTLCDESPDHIAVLPEDVDYLLTGYNFYIESSLKAKDVLGSFVGLRPLIRSGPGEPSSLSREFRVFASPSGLLSVAGGKFTTYRRMAEIVTDLIARRLGCRRLPQTRHFALDGAPQIPWALFERSEIASLVGRYGLTEPSARHLVRRYGRRAADVAAYLKGNPSLVERVTPDEPDLRVELVYQKENEMAVYATDLLLRRTRLGLFHPELLLGPADPSSNRPMASHCARSEIA